MELNFKPVTIKEKEIFDRYFNQQRIEASEFTFTNIFTWSFSDKFEYTIFLDHLLISFFDGGTRKLYQPIGKLPHLVIEKLLKLYPDFIFERVEKKIADNLSKELNIIPQWDMFDYVYSVKDLAELEGNKYEAKRNFINQCNKYNPETCILDETTVSSFFSLQDRWCDLKNCREDQKMHAEDTAVKHALLHFKDFSLFGICIHIDGKIEAFAIGEKLNDDTFVEHFEKANTGFKGLYQYVLNELAKSIPKQYLYLNREQDLGIQGLRVAKESYHPVKMIEKFRISVK